MVLFSCAYKMVFDTLAYLVRTIEIEVVVVPIIYPVESEAQLIDSFKSTMQSTKGVKLCIFDHISSMVCTTFQIHLSLFTLYSVARDDLSSADSDPHCQGAFLVGADRRGARPGCVGHRCASHTG